MDLVSDENGGESDGYEFLLNRVFTTLSYPDELGYEALMNYKFIYPVICYFFNGLLNIENLPTPDISDVNLIRNVELCYETLYASVLAKHLDLFQLVRRMYLSGNPDMILLQLWASKLEWSNLALSAAKYSNMEILKESLDLIEKLPTDISDELPEKLVVTTARRGIFSIFEVAFKRFLQIHSSPKNLSELLRKCVQNSKSLPVAEGVDILDLILDCQDEDLLDKSDSQGNTVLFEQNISIDVLVYLAEKDVKLATRKNNLNENIVHLVVRYLAAADLHRFFNLPTVKNGLLRLLEMKNYVGITAFQSIVMNLDPLEKTMELITSLPGFEISHFESPNSSILAEAVVHERHNTMLKHLVKCGASMNSFLESQSFSGNEIHFAITYKNLFAVDFFLEQGVHFLERNKEGELPLEYAYKLLAREDISEELMFRLREVLQKRREISAKRMLRPEHYNINPPPENMNNPFQQNDALPDFYGLNFRPSFLSLSKQQKTRPEESVSFG